MSSTSSNTEEFTYNELTEQYVKATRLIEHLKSQRNRSKRAFDKAMDLVLKYDARIAELKGLVDELIEAGNKLGTYFIGYTPRKKELLQREFWEAWRSAVSDWQSMTSHVTNPSDSQGIVTRNGGEG